MHPSLSGSHQPLSVEGLDGSPGWRQGGCRAADQSWGLRPKRQPRVEPVVRAPAGAAERLTSPCRLSSPLPPPRSGRHRRQPNRTPTDFGCGSEPIFGLRALRHRSKNRCSPDRRSATPRPGARESRNAGGEDAMEETAAGAEAPERLKDRRRTDQRRGRVGHSRDVSDASTLPPDRASSGLPDGAHQPRSPARPEVTRRQLHTKPQ